MNQQIEFDVQVTTKDMYKFLLCHTYSSFGGWFGIFLSLAAIFLLVTDYQSYDDAGKMILVVIALAFTIVNPLMLLSKAKQQTMTNPVYKQPLHYQLTQEGITVSQDGQAQTMPWSALRKKRKLGGVLFVYSSRVHAFIFPCQQLGAQAQAVEDCVQEHLTKAQVS